MDLYRSIEGLLKMHKGTVSFDEAVNFLETRYSKKTIHKFLKKNKEYFKYDGKKISSYQIKIELFLIELKSLISKYELNFNNVKMTVLTVLGLHLKKELHGKLQVKTYRIHPASRNFYIDLEASSIWDDEFFSTPEKKYRFTSQLFEFLLTEEFGEYGLFTTPLTIIKLLSKFMPIKNKIKLYNPTSGFLSLATALTIYSSSNFKIKASEINKSIFGYGKLFSEINNVIVNYSCTDSCDEVLELKSSSYDVILGNLPFASKQTSPNSNNRKYSELSLHIISESLSKLADNGRAFFLVNDGVLFSLSKEKIQFRQEIVDSEMLKTIISLPTNILRQTSVKTSLLVFEKGNRKENIQFIDASSKLLSFLNPDKSISLKVDKIESLINWNNANDSNVINESLVGYGNDDFDLKIPVKDIQVREYDLTTGKYIAEQETYGDDYVSLDSIVSKRKASLVNIEKLLPFIRVSDLNGKILKDFSKIGLNTTSRKGKHINKPSILIGTVGESFKPTLYEGKFDIEVSSNIAIFEFDQDMVFAPYLVQELNADYTRKQMNLLSKGSAMKHISVNDILSVRVKLPPLNKQKKIFSDRNEYSDAHGLSEKSEEKTISDAEIFQVFRHEIGNILYGPEAFLGKLPGFFERHDIDLNNPIVKGGLETIGDKIASSSKSLKQVHWVMENMKGVLHSSKESFNPENIELKPFIEKCIDNEVSKDELTWYVIVDGSFEGTTRYFAEIDKSQFENVIRNMVVNAIKHGKGDEPLQLVVNIMDYSEFIEKEDEYIQIEFINDGNPLPAKVNIDIYTEFGKKAGATKGQGLGGFLINRIVQNHNGGIEIIPPGNKIEPVEGHNVISNVHFSITIPKNQ